jgi:hypothetical protein
LIGQPTEITTIATDYAAGRIPWSEARDRLLNFDFLHPSDEDYNDNADGRNSFFGTWDEVLVCKAKGLIGEEEYIDLLQGMVERAEDQ